jgi:hypothetical protein
MRITREKYKARVARRKMLGGAAAGATAVATGTVGRAFVSQAAGGDPLLAGRPSTSTTGIVLSGNVSLTKGEGEERIL